jgi:hypothetical protein
MRHSTTIVTAVCALIAAQPSLAADLPKGALCALGDVMECDVGQECERVSPEQIAVPRFIRVELGQRTLQGVGPRARDRVTKISSVDQRGGLIFAQGIDDAIEGERSALAWVIALGAQEGSLQLTVTGDDVTFVATGECIVDK